MKLLNVIDMELRKQIAGQKMEYHQLMGYDWIYNQQYENILEYHGTYLLEYRSLYYPMYLGLYQFITGNPFLTTQYNGITESFEHCS